ncbi:MAG TPA: Crp/Fnr family transcriptional regulator [Actinomycetota bacterium]|nr:Crp/Fnr family transcriptional regulator [Actinomycetota bacterium]
MHRPTSPVLDPLTPNERDRLLARAVDRRLHRGDTLAFAGTPAERVHVVTAGVLKLVGRDVDGGETILGLCLAGDVAGAVAAVDGGAHPYDYVAATAVTALGIDAALFVDVVGRNPGACLALGALLGRRVRWLCDAALERTSAHVAARLAGRLLDLAELLGRRRGSQIDVELPFPQRDLGGLAGMCRESACKTLSRWKSEGTVDYEGRELRILRPDVLSRIRCAGRGGGLSP